MEKWTSTATRVNKRGRATVQELKASGVWGIRTIEETPVFDGQANVPDVARSVVVGVQLDLEGRPSIGHVLLGEKAKGHRRGARGEERQVDAPILQQNQRQVA
jgi:hypothetical protein